MAVCPLRGVTSIELNMGPSGDMVKVRDRLPIPLTVYLGAGSDKFIGNGERDTCYPQGARRNRCVGGSGNDWLYGGSNPDQLYGGRGFDRCDGGHGWGRSHACEAGPRR